MNRALRPPTQQMEAFPRYQDSVCSAGCTHRYICKATSGSRQPHLHTEHYGFSAAALYGFFVMPPTETTPEMAVPPAAAGRCGNRFPCAMSDADTEGSGGAAAWEPDISITSSESDGPCAVGHTSTHDTREGEATAVEEAGGSESQHTEELSSTSSPGTEAKPEPKVNPELAANLVRQVEEYLGDEGLAKDLFLLKHVRRQRAGYISLKLLSGYKRIKKFSRDCDVLAAALRTSKALELNPEGTKVRRRAPLPEALQHEAPASRTLLAAHVPEHSATMGVLAALFGQFGSVVSLQVLRPRQDGVPHPEVLPLAASVPDLSSATCAVVEYETVWGAARALQDLNSPPISLHVLRRARRHSLNSVRVSPTPPFPYRHRGSCDSGVLPDELRQRLKGTSACMRQEQTESSASESEETPQWRRGSLGWNCPPFTQASRTIHQTRDRWNSSSVPSSPALRRRHTTQAVLRAPRGPDGTRGFAKDRSS